MGRIIAVASGKGGAGKTTFVCNLATALAKQGKDVVAVDANLTTPNLGVHLGIPLYPVTLQDVLSGDAKLKEALYSDKSGIKVLPADMSITRLSKTTPNELVNVLYKLADGFDFVLLKVTPQTHFIHGAISANGFDCYPLFSQTACLFFCALCFARLATRRRKS